MAYVGTVGYAQLISLKETCLKFVENTEPTREDGAHDADHILRAMHTAHDILSSDYRDKDQLFWYATIVVAGIHDYTGIDHKFLDSNGAALECLRSFLRGLNLIGHIGLDLTDDLINVARHISYSKENNAIMAGKPLDFKALLSNPNLPEAHIIRDIVSDADKLDTIGIHGVPRLVRFIRYTLRKEYGRDPTNSEVYQLVFDYSQQKILRLKDNFIRTTTGKQLAIKAHQSFVDALVQCC